MSFWSEDPAPVLTRVFGEIAATRMQGVPICNPQLQVAAVGFRQRGDAHWAGVMVTPWAINLLCLPGTETGWPAVAAGACHSWHFPSGDYEFIPAHEPQLGEYHLCSLFSPALEFASQEAALMVAQAVVEGLFAAPPPAPATPVPGRRAFLGLGR